MTLANRLIKRVQRGQSADIVIESYLEDSAAADAAKKRGLTSAGFGRWKDKSGKVVAKSEKGKLVDVTPSKGVPSDAPHSFQFVKPHKVKPPEKAVEKEMADELDAEPEDVVVIDPVEDPEGHKKTKDLLDKKGKVVKDMTDDDGNGFRVIDLAGELFVEVIEEAEELIYTTKDVLELGR